MLDKNMEEMLKSLTDSEIATLIAAANTNFLVLQIIAAQKLIITLAINAGIQKNFLHS